MVDDLPLPRARVLRLVDQHVIDAAVELVMHPARRDALEHLQRLVDEVVIVEQPALQLLAPVIRRGRGRDMQQRLRAVARDDGAALFDQRREALASVLEQPRDGRIVVARISW